MNRLCKIRRICDSRIKASANNIQAIRFFTNHPNNPNQFQKKNTPTNFDCTYRHYKWKNVKSAMIFAGIAPFFSYFQKKEDDENQTLLDKIKKLILPDFILVLFQERDNTPEGQLIMNIKLAILAIHRKQYDKAEKLLHLALRMAQDLHHFNAVTLCFDIMANLAMETEQYEKAEKLFVTVMQRLMQKGSKEDDIEILHLGLKVAEIAESEGKLEKAEQGYVWALGKLESKISSTPDPKDLIMLYGLANDYYGRLLMQKGQYALAKSYLVKSHDIFLQVNDAKDPEVIDLLNNLAVVNTHLGDLAAAEDYINRALILAEDFHETQNTAVYQANRGMLLMKQGLLEKAKEVCTAALQSAKENNISNGREQATYCLEQLKEFQKKKQEN